MPNSISCYRTGQKSMNPSFTVGAESSHPPFFLSLIQFHSCRKNHMTLCLNIVKVSDGAIPMG